MSMPEGFTPISTEEAVRRIKERDHLDARQGATMPFINEQALVHLLQTGEAIAGLTPEGRLAFTAPA